MTNNGSERPRFGYLARIAGATVPLALLASANAMAACNDRPGTPFPSRVQVDEYLPTDFPVNANTAKLSFIWRNTQREGGRYYDVQITDGAGHTISNLSGYDSLSGFPPATTHPYGDDVNIQRTNLQFGMQYCFIVRARTEGGTQGCVSAQWSKPACGATPTQAQAAAQVAAERAANAKPAPSTPGGSPAPRPTPVAAAAPVISIAGQPNNTLVITGSGFTANAQLQLRVTDQALHSIPAGTNNGQAIRSDASGKMNQTVHGLCQSPGLIFIAATDGRPNAADKTGFLWSNTFNVTCTAG